MTWRWLVRKGQDEIIGLRIVYVNKVLVRAGKSWQWLQNSSERGEGRGGCLGMTTEGWVVS